MLLFSSDKFYNFIFFLNILIIKTESIPVVSTTSLARARGRSRSMSMGSSKVHQPVSISSSSSARSSNEGQQSRTQTIPLHSESIPRYLEREPLVEAAKSVRFDQFDPVILREATASTNVEHIDPTRDGVFSRIRQGINRNAAPFSLGTAIGVILD